MKSDHPKVNYGKTGVLIVNLGTPDSTSWLDIRKYLREFLSDRRVIEVNPTLINDEISIPVQGGLDPNILVTDKENIKKETLKYLNIFKDHPYIFNLGHGILPETKIEMVEDLINIVRNFKWSQNTQKLIMAKLVF